VPQGKIEPKGGEPMTTEHVLMHVLRLHREVPLCHQEQAKREWLRRPSSVPTRVALAL
jgi:glyoxylate/hydroxypyruvate reductase A